MKETKNSQEEFVQVAQPAVPENTSEFRQPTLAWARHPKDRRPDGHMTGEEIADQRTASFTGRFKGTFLDNLMDQSFYDVLRRLMIRSMDPTNFSMA